MRLLSLLILTFIANSAQAYVGPGMGLGVIAVLLGAIATVLLAVFGVFWYPIKKMIKRKKKADTQDKVSHEEEEDGRDPEPVD